jgi:predicted phage gp36 major capsid-like protein
MDTTSMTAAPEIKAVPDRIEDAFDGFMSAFEAFKNANDKRLDEIEKKLSADVVTRCGSSATFEL